MAGESPEGFYLASVFVVIRHGDRTPMTSFLGVPRPSPRLGCTMDPQFLQSVPQLRGFLADMEAQRDRQPARSDFAHWALYPQHSECSSSQLTGVGAVQHLLNGLALREKYVKGRGLFGPRFSPSTQLDLRSTLISRTYQSAVALLYAFLPRFNLTELDIHAARNSMFCSPGLVPGICCSNLVKLKQEADKGPHRRGERNPAWLPAMGALSEVFGVRVNHLPWPTALVDLLQGHACHGLPLPCGDGGNCVTAQLMDKLWALVDSDARSFTQNSRYDRYCRTIVHSLLLEILTNMERVTRNQSPVKFTLFSGHDLTVTPLLQALGVHDGKWPHYATRVVFELYRKLRAQGAHYIRVVHNGRDITPRVRFCRGRTEAGMCPLKYFQYFVERENMEVMEASDRQSLASFCRSKALV